MFFFIGVEAFIFKFMLVPGKITQQPLHVCSLTLNGVTRRPLLPGHVLFLLKIASIRNLCLIYVYIGLALRATTHTKLLLYIRSNHSPTA